MHNMEDAEALRLRREAARPKSSITTNQPSDGGWGFSGFVDSISTMLGDVVEVVAEAGGEILS